MPNSDLILCEKCFAMMPSGAEFCTECGAPMLEAKGVLGSDAEIYPELARANLLRMRHEYKPAEDICLGILRRFPNNESANELLGDICAERGDHEQAVEWYELALDLVPDSATVRGKLEASKGKIVEVQTSESVASLGMAHTRKPPYAAIFGIAVVLVIGIVGIGMALKGGQPSNKAESKPLDLGAGVTTTPVTSPVQVPDIPKTPVYVADAELARKIAQALTLEEGRLIGADSEESTGAVKLTYLLKADEEWIVRAKLVSKAFELGASVPTVELVLRRDFTNTANLIVERAKYDTSLTDEWKNQTGGTDEALVELLFGHKLPIRADPPPAETSEPATTTEPGNTSEQGTGPSGQ